MRAPGPLDVLLGVLAGLVTLVWFAPTSGQDSQPPRCWNVVGSEVPCDNALWPGWLVVVVVVVTLGSWAVRAWRARGDHAPVAGPLERRDPWSR